MDVYEGLAAAAGRLPGAAICIGNFDGVHLGHRRLIDLAVADARARKVQAVALTFWPHPAQVLSPGREPALIVSRARRLELLAEAGLDAVIEQPFTRDFAAVLPADFTRLLLDDVGVGSVTVGYDFTYGRQRGGTTQTLEVACRERGARLTVVQPVTVNGLVVSSSKIRGFVLSCNVDAAAALLGRPFEVEGIVVRGAGRGRTIGVPTANIAPDETDGSRALLPGIGVYATRVLMPDGTAALGACNVGLNPTFHPESTSGVSPNGISVEVYILDTALDLYGQHLRVSFVAHIRPERKFSSVDALVAEIQRDIVETRRLLQ